MTSIKRGFVGAKEFYREPTLVYHNHGFKACGGLENFTSTIGEQTDTTVLNLVISRKLMVTRFTSTL